MKLNIILNRWGVLLLVFFAVAFTACNEEDDLSGQVVLEAYGPSPALRGSDLTFIGQNLDKVTSVILPDQIEITDIEVISSEKISVTIPQDAKEGYVKLVYPDGEITSKTLLAYTEPISISSISPNPVKAGQALTITGDYLNLVQKVIFADEVEVLRTGFTTWERAKIELVLPKEARTGTIILSDTSASPFELEADTVLQITLPSVSLVATLENKKPDDEISIEGSDLDLVESVLLPNDVSVEFTVSGNTLLFTLPSGTIDGTISMIAYSGVAVPIAQITMAVPTELTASPATALRADDEIAISGTNMDLVTTLIFPGTTDEVTPNSIVADKITVTMPSAATSGDITLNTASGKTATIAIETQKPEVTSYSPSPVSAGNDVVIAGTNLDLVISITFTGDVTVEVSPSSETSITVTVPVDAETGELTLTMANGETVTATSLEIDKPEFCYIPELPGDSVEINAGEIFSVDVQNSNVLTDVQVDGSTTQYILQGSTLYVLIPGSSSGTTELTLVSSNGEVTYEIDVIGSGTTETVVFEGPISLTWSDGGRAVIPASTFDEVSAGTVMKIYFTQMDDWGQAQINNGAWSTIPFEELGNDGYITTDTYSDKSVSEQELTLTQDILDNIRNNAGDFNGVAAGIIIQGQNWIISKISIIVTASTETPIMEETHDLGSWTGEADGGAFRLYKSSFADLSAGSTLKFYFTVTGDGQLQINDANWAQQGDIIKFTDETYYEMELTQDFLDHILNTNDGWSETALVIQGQNLVVSKVSVIPF